MASYMRAKMRSDSPIAAHENSFATTCARPNESPNTRRSIKFSFGAFSLKMTTYLALNEIEKKEEENINIIEDYLKSEEYLKLINKILGLSMKILKILLI